MDEIKNIFVQNKIKKSPIEKLYEIAKEFAESKAKIKMPAFEKFRYDNCTYKKKYYSYNEFTNEVIQCYDIAGNEWLIYKDNKKCISLRIDYDEDESHIKITKTYNDYSIVYNKEID